MLDILLAAGIGYWTGVSLCAGVVGGGLWNGWRNRRRDDLLRRAAEQEQQAFRARIDARRLRVRASDPQRAAWQGTRPFRIAALADECRDCRSFYLTPADGQPLPAYQPGQYLTFELPQPGSAKPLVRCYSLSDRPGRDYYRITVKRVGPTTNAPAGKGSNFLFTQMGVGHILAVRAPGGGFFLDPVSRRPVALVASGIGITPLIAMLNAVVHEQPGREVFFFAGMRSGDQHPFRQHLRNLQAEHPSLRVVTCYSNPHARDIPGSDYQFRGRLSVEVLRQVLPSNNFGFYVCGAGNMMGELIPALEAWGVPPEELHFEAFGPSTVKRVAPATDAVSSADVAHQVHFARSQQTTPWTVSAGTLLETAERYGVTLDSGCRAGNCGQCAVKLLAGKVRHQKKPGVALAADQCLTCIATPDGDVTLDA